MSSFDDTEQGAPDDIRTPLSLWYMPTTPSLRYLTLTIIAYVVRVMADPVCL